MIKLSTACLCGLDGALATEKFMQIYELSHADSPERCAQKRGSIWFCLVRDYLFHFDFISILMAARMTYGRSWLL